MNPPLPGRPRGQGRSSVPNIYYRSGPFVVQLRTDQDLVIRLLDQFYGAGWIGPGPEVAHFQIGITHPVGLRHWWRPQAIFELDGLRPFEPYPAAHAFPLLEWGLNWSIATRAHQYLMLHAGALERDGRALLLPAAQAPARAP